MTVLTTTEVVRRLFDARATGDVRRVMALMDPDVVAQAIAGGGVVQGSPALRAALADEGDGGRRVELDAHRFEAQPDGSVHVFGRIRVIEGGRLTDSPGAWRFVVRRGRVASIAPLAVGERLRRVA